MGYCEAHCLVNKVISRHELWRMSTQSSLDFLRSLPLTHEQCSRRFSAQTHSLNNSPECSGEGRHEITCFCLQHINHSVCLHHKKTLESCCLPKLRSPSASSSFSSRGFCIVFFQVCVCCVLERSSTLPKAIHKCIYHLHLQFHFVNVSDTFHKYVIYWLKPLCISQNSSVWMCKCTTSAL